MTLFTFCFKSPSSPFFKKPDHIISIGLLHSIHCLLGETFKWTRCINCPALSGLNVGPPPCRRCPCSRGFPLWCIIRALSKCRPLHLGWGLGRPSLPQESTLKLRCDNQRQTGNMGGVERREGHSRKREGHVWNRPLPIGSKDQLLGSLSNEWLQEWVENWFSCPSSSTRLLPSPFHAACTDRQPGTRAVTFPVFSSHWPWSCKPQVSWNCKYCLNFS